MDRALIGNKTGATRLGFAVLLNYSQRRAASRAARRTCPLLLSRPSRARSA